MELTVKTRVRTAITFLAPEHKSAMQFLDDEARAPPNGQAEQQSVGAARGNWRLSAKSLLLTYPRCDMHKDLALEHLLDKFPVENVIFIVVGHELHADGEDHLHALVLLRNRCNIRNPAYLDLVNVEGQRFHGNYQATRDVRAAYEYVTKDGDCCMHGEVPERLARKKTRAEHLEVIQQLDSEQQFLSYVFLNGLSTSANVLNPLWQGLKKSRTTLARYDLASFNVPDELTQELRVLEECKSALCIIGPTGIGKTQALLALLQDQQVRRLTELDDLRSLDSEASHLIFDDVELERLGRGPLLHLLDVQTERSIKCRYANANLKPNLRIILIGNSLELVLGKFSDDAAVLRRIRTLHLGPDKLFLDELPL